MRGWLVCVLLGSLALVGSALPAAAQSFTGLGVTPTHTSSFALGISGNGTTVVGFSGSHAMRWTAAGGAVDIGGSMATAASTDGSIIVGSSGSTPVRWIGGSTVPTTIPNLPGATIVLIGQANGVSGDGTRIVGRETYLSGGAKTHAFLWTAATGTQPLGGPTGGFAMSVANAISRDGTTIVGQGYPIDPSASNPSFPFYWRNSTTGKVSLGSLATIPNPANNGFATAVNADGSIIVGGSSSNGTVGFDTEAFRWDAVNGMVTLGDLAGGAVHSLATAINADGTVIVGNGYNAAGEQAVRWGGSAATMTTMAAYLNGLGVNIGTWQLFTATGVSADGLTIVGTGTNPSGNSEAWLAYVPLPVVNPPQPPTPPTQPGFISVGAFASSFAPVEAVLGASAGLAADGAGTAGDVALDYTCGQQAGACAYLLGGLGIGSDGTVLDPDFGLMMNFGSGLRAGLGISISASRENFSGGSWQSARFAGVQGFVSYAAPAGLEAMAAFSAGALGVSTSRVYLNGVTPETAAGSTTGDGESLALRLGWRVPVGERSSITPFVRYDATRAALGGFTETSAGAFPATVGPRGALVQDISLGAEFEAVLDPATTVHATASWRHRLSATADPLVASVPGVLTLALPGGGGAADAAEVELGLTHALSEQAELHAAVNGQISANGLGFGAQVGFTFHL